MTELKEVLLEARGVRFYSQYDEAVFFKWLRDLPCVVNVEGQGLTIFIACRSDAIDEDALREILALFHRYGIEKRQLAQFDRAEFLKWFRNPVAYWYSEVFD
ncbi:hypothetical protein PV762_04190 [Mitsuaria sp. CC2]|uniref:hypothetical protein n=1 Tax=Mitsuaria sp. CC2 TaxID=3029186 RepID=UPI003B8E282E